MSEPIFYDLWTEALERLVRAREEAEFWRQRAEMAEEIVVRLSIRNRALKDRLDTPPTLAIKVEGSPGTNGPDPLR